MVNKKAQAQYAMAFMLAVTVIILALAWAAPVNEITNSARNDSFNGGETGSGMNCSSGTISDFTNAGCLVADIGQGYFIIGLLGLAGVIIAARVVFA
jgi:hypothetical protein